jgi:uncharacterized protein GlcG (DUF336 family)
LEIVPASPSFRPVASDDAVRETIRGIVNAAHPLIVLGGGASRHGLAPAFLRRIAPNAHSAVCVTDGRDDMAAFGRMDYVNATPVTTALGKAHTVLVFGIPTRVVAEPISSGTMVSVTVKAPRPGEDDLTFQRGGLPIMKDGKMIGSIGVGWNHLSRR